jgi:hypothetical protein
LKTCKRKNGGVFEKRVLRIFGPEMAKVTGGWRNLLQELSVY